jgi:hypothetical protein
MFHWGDCPWRESPEIILKIPGLTALKVMLSLEKSIDINKLIIGLLKEDGRVKSHSNCHCEAQSDEVIS